MVIQRNNNNSATVQIAGSYAQQLDAVEARVVARVVNGVSSQGATTSWKVLQANPTNGQFNGTITATGGWYQVEVRGLLKGQVIASDALDRFGVGEVFAIVGHSNAQGSACTIDGVDRCPTRPGADDDRVTVIGIDQSTPEFYQYELTADTRYLPGLAFTQLQQFSGMAPFAKVAWLWGRMGDLLVQQINVPVLIYNAGFGGSNMEQTYKAAYDIPFDHGFIRYGIRMPYVNLRNLMNLYVPSTGIRAILLQHGENDRGNPTDSTLKYNRGVIDKSRTEFNKPDLAWIVSLSSFVGGRFQNVRDAQTQIINQPGYRTFQGPDLDNITSLSDRPDGLHFSPDGQAKAGELWANAIAAVFRDAASHPMAYYAAEQQPLASIACATTNQLVLKQPSGYDYSWNTGSTDQSLTVGAGTYSARVRNTQKKIYFPPAITVPANVKPATPTISPSSSLSICQSTGVTLTSSYTALNQWSTGATTPTITVKSAGTYTLQAKNPVYGCLSNAVTKTVSLADADLSLSLRVSRRTPVVGDTVTYTMTVRNESNCDAGSVTMQNRLPDNVTFVSSPDNLFAISNIVLTTLPSIPAGGTVSRRYVVRLNAPGTYRNAVELITQSNPDPDSKPNSGTEDGQDDMSVNDLRTTSASESTSQLYVSPNPNQTPLPAVQSNQPAPDPNKADLSLLLQISNHSVSVGQEVTFTLIVQNVGGQTANNVKVQNTLPTGFQFKSSTSGMTASGSVVSGTISQLAPGQSVSLQFSAKASKDGSFTNAAQITASDQADPDSTPNNGTTNGEDDAARADLRVTAL